MVRHDKGGHTGRLKIEIGVIRSGRSIDCDMSDVVIISLDIDSRLILKSGDRIEECISPYNLKSSDNVIVGDAIGHARQSRIATR